MHSALESTSLKGDIYASTFQVNPGGHTGTGAVGPIVSNSGDLDTSVADLLLPRLTVSERVKNGRDGLPR